MHEFEMWEVVVIGAGMAGLAAARVLAEGGLRVLVVEARDRVGGRLMTVHSPDAGVPVELGAEFIHGRPPELLSLLREAGLATVDVTGEQYCYENGVLAACSEDRAFAWLDELSEEEDITFDAFLAKSNAPEAEKAAARGYVEGFNAADAGRIGTAGLARQQAAEDAIEGNLAARPVAGYSALAAYMAQRYTAAGGGLRLSSPVAHIRWEPRSASVLLNDGTVLRARHLVITLPLGVLQAGCVLFEPRPTSFASLGSLAMGPVQRLVLVFRERYWKAGMSFLFARDQFPGVWWTTAPRDSSVLTGWIGGPRALSVVDPEDLLAQALESLEQILSRAPGSLCGALLSWHLHDWQADPYSCCAYSYALVGGLATSAALAEPIAGTLFFAGEHTDTTGHPGTVHGALRSGLRAAAQVLAVREHPGQVA